MHFQIDLARATVVLAEDDETYGNLLREFLAANGYEVTLLPRAEDLSAVIAGTKPAAILIDQFIGRHDMIEVIPALRSACRVPILMLSSNTDPTDRVLSLERGADDYISKLVPPREILARIRGCIRRYRDTPAGDVSDADSRPRNETVTVGDVSDVDSRPRNETVTVGDWTLHRDSGRVTSTFGHELLLPAQEFEMAWLLFSEPAMVLHRKYLIDKALPSRVRLTDRRIDNLVSRLRRRFRNAGADLILLTARHVGYALQAIVYPADGAAVAGQGKGRQL